MPRLYWASLGAAALTLAAGPVAAYVLAVRNAHRCGMTERLPHPADLLVRWLDAHHPQ